jgi:GNAT superfamily N-acetyltransferase
VQDASYPEPENLIPASMLPRLLTWQDDARRNFVLVAEENGVVLGGSVFHLFGVVHTGFSSFMAVAHQARGRGISRLLHEARFTVLDEYNGREVDGVFIDVLNPKRMSAQQLEHERSVGADAFARRAIFDRLGFRRVAFAYQQPIGGPDGGPITTMDLLFCPHPGRVVSNVPTQTVLDTMRAYWSAWLQPARMNAALERIERLSGGPLIGLESAVVD